jgi:hypothetical protein
VCCGREAYLRGGDEEHYDFVYKVLCLSISAFGTLLIFNLSLSKSEVSGMYVTTSPLHMQGKALWHLGMLVGAVLVLGCPWTASLTSAAPGAQPPTPTLWVNFHAGRLSIEATEARWLHVVDAVRHQTGIRLHLYIPLEGVVTVSVHDLPVEHALTQLFGAEVNLAFRYPPATRRRATAPAAPSDVWVLGRGLGTAWATPADPGTEAAGARAAPAALGAATPEEQLAALDAFAEQGDREALQQALTDPDPSVQRKALELLSARDGPGTLALLADLAQSADPAAQMQALFLLYDTGLADPAVPIESVLFEGQWVILQGQEFASLPEPPQ